MSSVKGRIKQVKQPRGGYIRLSSFTKTAFNDGFNLNDKENVHASIIGMVIDYMTRFFIIQDAEKAFEISLTGYCNRVRILSSSISDKEVKLSGILKESKGISLQKAKEYIILAKDGENGAFELITHIKGLDDESIIAACKIVTYDVWFRNPIEAMESKGAEYINPDKETLDNVRILIQRSLSFWKNFGPIVAEGFKFSEENKGKIIKSGYSKTVDSGEGDYLTNDTIWDFKVSKSAPTNQHTLQILMYYVMGKHSNMDIFKNIKSLGFFNPRLNTMYILDVNDIPQETIQTIEKEIICY